MRGAGALEAVRTATYFDSQLATEIGSNELVLSCIGPWTVIVSWAEYCSVYMGPLPCLLMRRTVSLALLGFQCCHPKSKSESCWPLAMPCQAHFGGPPTELVSVPLMK